MYALIQKTDNQILRVSAEGASLAAEKPFYWVECPDECTNQWIFDGHTFTAPVSEPPTTDQLAASIRADRDQRIADMAWRYERIARQERLGLTPADNIAVLDAYVQALADITEQVAFPQSVTWPEVPA